MKNDFISEFVEYLVEEGQTYFLEYGFKLGDTIRFTPSEVGKILKEYFDQQKERGNMIDRNGAIRVISGYKGVVDKSVAKRLLMQMDGQPEIIRCKYCKYAHLTYDGDCKYCDKWLDDDDFHLTLYLGGDFYCGYAERRTDE